MTMKKYADGESKLEVLRGHEAEALAKFEAKVGKTFNELEDDERKELHKLLDEASKKNAADDKEAAKAQDTLSDESGTDKPSV